MNCPLDNTPLAMTERAGVEIDYCPSCRGVWLDRGELDKIIDRANQEADSASITNDRDDEDREAPGPGGKQQKKRRGSFLSEMFEFGE